MKIPFMITPMEYVFFLMPRPVRVALEHVQRLGMLDAIRDHDDAKLSSLLEEYTVSGQSRLQKAVEQIDSLVFATTKVNDEEPVVTIAHVDSDGKEHPLPTVLADLLLSMYNAGDRDFSHWTKFVKRLMEIENDHTRNELYSFLQSAQIAITEDGTFIAYKGVNDDFWSVQGNHKTRVLSGKVDERGRILNKVGSIIAVNPEDVEHDCDVACAPGLHVGSYEYASGHGSTVVAVEVDPRDVVSVPTDCSCQKCRVSRYKVYNVVSQHLGLGTATVDEDNNVSVRGATEEAPTEVINKETPAMKMLLPENISATREGIRRNIVNKGGETTVAQLTKSVGRKYNAKYSDMIAALLKLGFNIKGDGCSQGASTVTL